MEACRIYKVKPPALNADLFSELLSETDINKPLQNSLVRGWREGFDLGSELPQENHLAKPPILDETKKKVLREGLMAKVRRGKMVGPLEEPLSDNRWFQNHWVSPYFVIPKSTPPGAAQKWRLIHHLSWHQSGSRSASLNGHIDTEKFPTVFPRPRTGAHVVFCLNPPGSALLGRDIRDYYRNFLLSPWTWWKTYTFALGSFWANPYLPFGGSSCTSIAQRQSDAIRKVARVYGVKASSVAMLDDFLLVSPRKLGDTDEETLLRGGREGALFDKLLTDLKLPVAVEKSQQAAFTTVWCGVQYYSKTGVYGAPPSKWAKLKAFYTEHCIKPNGEHKESIKARILQTLLGKFAHFMTVWPAGRPCLYYLWKLLITAGTWKSGKFKIHRANKLLRFDANCMRALARWGNRLEIAAPPVRRMLP